MDVTAEANKSEMVREVLRETHAARKTFPEVVGTMLGAGVESYFVDLRRKEDVVYLGDDTVVTEPLDVEFGKVAPEFSKDGIVAAIRGAQKDEIRYPEFLRRAAEAGVTAYWALLTGKRVIYFGRRGEMHVEWFPGAEPAGD